jgi:hypothetical protein
MRLGGPPVISPLRHSTAGAGIKTRGYLKASAPDSLMLCWNNVWLIPVVCF